MLGRPASCRAGLHELDPPGRDDRSSASDESSRCRRRSWPCVARARSARRRFARAGQLEDRMATGSLFCPSHWCDALPIRTESGSSIPFFIPEMGFYRTGPTETERPDWNDRSPLDLGRKVRQAGRRRRRWSVSTSPAPHRPGRRDYRAPVKSSAIAPKLIPELCRKRRRLTCSPAERVHGSLERRVSIRRIRKSCLTRGDRPVQLRITPRRV